MGNDRVILITGTSGGIGSRLVEHYRVAGTQVVGCSRGDVPDGDGYHHFALDIANEADVKSMFAAIRREYGRLDVLINNAGAFAKSFAMTASAETVREVMNTNLLGTVLCSREAVKIMQKASSGRIVFISSVAVPLATVGNSVYSASKAGSEQFARVLAKEVVAFGVTVNVLGLSIVDEPGMADQIAADSVSGTLAQTVLGRTLRIEDVTNAVDFLISDASSAVTSQTIYLGGV